MDVRAHLLARLSGAKDAQYRHSNTVVSASIEEVKVRVKLSQLCLIIVDTIQTNAEVLHLMHDGVGREQGLIMMRRSCLQTLKSVEKATGAH